MYNKLIQPIELIPSNRFEVFFESVTQDKDFFDALRLNCNFIRFDNSSVSMKFHDTADNVILKLLSNFKFETAKLIHYDAAHKPVRTVVLEFYPTKPVIDFSGYDWEYSNRHSYIIFERAIKHYSIYNVNNTLIHQSSI